MMISTTVSCSMRALLLIYILVRSSMLGADGLLEAVAIIPHGDFAYDPDLLPRNSDGWNVAKRIHLAAQKVGKWLDNEIRPDLVFLSTPHGIALEHDFGLYLGDLGRGVAWIGQDLHTKFKPYRVDLNASLAPFEASRLLNRLNEENVTGINSSLLKGESVRILPLQWGEVIPLSFLSKNNTLRIQNQRRHLILSQPTRRFNHSVAMIPELLRLGHQLRDWFDSSSEEQRDKKIAVIISADLSHTHRPDGPYGYSKTSQFFDEAVVDWIRRMNDFGPCSEESQEALLKRAAKWQPTALSCGFTGMVIAHGMVCPPIMNGHNMLFPSRKSKFSAKVMASGNATYYGMMVAVMKRQAADCPLAVT